MNQLRAFHSPRTQGLLRLLFICIAIAVASYTIQTLPDNAVKLMLQATCYCGAMFFMSWRVSCEALHTGNLRWVFYLWFLVLLGVQMFCSYAQAYHPTAELLVTSMLAAQVSFFVYWGFLGHQSGMIRYMSLCVLGPLLIAIGFTLDRRGVEIWAMVVFCQIAVLVATVVLLIVTNIRFRVPSHEREKRRFGIAELMLLTASVVPVLLLAKNYEILRLTALPWHLALSFLGFALVIAMLSLSTLLTVMNKTRGLWFLLTTACFVAAAACFWQMDRAIRFGSSTPVNWTQYRWQDHTLAEAHQVGIGWAAWAILFASFLAGMLAVFRFDGCYFGRRRKTVAVQE